MLVGQNLDSSTGRSYRDLGVITMHCTSNMPAMARLLSFGALLLVACSSAAGPGNNTAAGGAGIGGEGMGGGGHPQGGSSGSGGTSTAGGAAGHSGQGGSSGTGAGPNTCVGLAPSAAVQALYALPAGATTWLYAGSDESGTAALVGVPVNRSVRLLALTADGASTELLNESEYTKIGRWTRLRCKRREVVPVSTHS